MTEIMQRILQSIVSKLAYIVWTPCKIVSQSADLLTVGITTSAFGPIKDARLITGLPGVKVKVQLGTSALVSFEGGLSGKPIVSLMASDVAPLEIRFDAPIVSLGGAGESPVMRVSDTLDLNGTVNGNPFKGTATLTPGQGSKRVKA